MLFHRRRVAKNSRRKAIRLSFWDQLFSGSDFMPRRYCGTWDDGLIALHVVSDVVIWLAYLWIPLVMLGTWRIQKRAVALPRPVLLILILYVIFITACGWTHFFDALMFWDPVYRVNGLVRALTAVASLGTAISVVRLFPLAINAPVTILTQRASLRQQFAWLRDILDSVTDGRLRLCESRSDLPAPVTQTPAAEIAVRRKTNLAAARRGVAQAAVTAGFSLHRIGDLLTASHEAAMNGLQHAHGADVRVYQSGDCVQVWIVDAGSGIPLDRLPISTLKQGFSTAGTAGQGWFLVLTLADAAYLYTGPDGTTVVLEMHSKEHTPIPIPATLGGDVAVVRLPA